MKEDWVEAFRGTNLPRVHLAKTVLEDSGIKAVILNQQDSAYISFGDIILYVSKDDLLKAKRLLENF